MEGRTIWSRVMPGPWGASESQNPLAGGFSPTLEANGVVTCFVAFMSPQSPARTDLMRMQPSILPAGCSRLWGTFFLWLSANVIVTFFISGFYISQSS